MMKNLQLFLVQCMSLLFMPLRWLPFKWQEKFVDALMSALTRSGNYFNTFHQRPKKAADVALDPSVTTVTHSLAVVMQGPLVLQDDFTLETVRLYRRSFAGCALVISTWEGEDAATLAALRDAGAIVVTSPRPANSGAANVNFQIVSTLSGLRAAKELGTIYVIKTRCDQRFYAAGLPDILIGLLEKYTVSPELCFGMQQRIIGLNINTARHRPYAFSDMFQFGLLIDLLSLWDLPLDERSISAGQIWKNAPSSQEISRQKIGEAYVYISYMEKIGRMHDFSYEDHYSILRDQFIIIDKEILDLFWFKYGFSEYRVCSDPKYSSLRAHSKINFRDWVALQGKREQINLPSDVMLVSPEIFE